MHKASTDVAAASMLFICQLADIEDVRPLLRTAGAGALVVEVLQMHVGRRAIAVAACTALTALASSPRRRSPDGIDVSSLIAAGAAEAVAAVLGKHAGDAALVRLCLQLVDVLASDAAATPGLIAAGLPAALVSALQRHAGVISVVRASCKAAATLATRRTTACQALLSAGAATALAAVVHAPEEAVDAESLKSAVTTLSLLAAAAAGLGHFPVSAVASAAAAALRRCEADTPVCAALADLLAYLTRYEEGVKQVQSTRVDGPLIAALLRHRREGALLRDTAIVLHRLARAADSAAVRQLIDAGASGALSRILQCCVVYTTAGTLGRTLQCLQLLYTRAAGSDVLKRRLLAPEVWTQLAVVLPKIAAHVAAGKDSTYSLCVDSVPKSSWRAAAVAACEFVKSAATGSALPRPSYMFQRFHALMSGVLAILNGSACRPVIMAAFGALSAVRSNGAVGAASDEEIGRVLVDLMRRRLDDAELAAMAMKELQERRSAACDSDPYLCAYGGASAVAAVFLRHSASMSTSVARAGCSLLASWASCMESRASLVRDGAVEALLLCASRFPADHVIAVHVCTAFTGMVQFRGVDKAAGFNDGSVCAVILACALHHGKFAPAALAALKAIAFIALSPTMGALFDRDSTMSAVEQLVQLHKDQKDAKAVVRAASFAVCLLQRCWPRSSGSTAITFSPQSLASACVEQRPRAALLAAAAAGSDCDVTAAAELARFLPKDDEFYWREAVELAASAGLANGTARLMQIGGGSGSFEWSEELPVLVATCAAAQHGQIALLHHLVRHWRARVVAEDLGGGQSPNSALWLAAERGDVASVALLLGEGGLFNDERGLDSDSGLVWDADPAVWVAARLGHAAVLERLLADGHADPASASYAALRMACERGHTECVRLLLADSRVSPPCWEDAAVAPAARAGHTETLQALLDDPRIDATDFARRETGSHASEDTSAYLVLPVKGALLRQPRMLHSALREAAARGLTKTHMMITRNYEFTREDVRAWAAAAWRRRRYAVRDWVMGRRDTSNSETHEVDA